MGVTYRRGAAVASLALLAACGDRSVPVSASGFGAFEPALAVLPGDELAVVWHDTRHGPDELYLRVLDADLDPLSPELRLTDTAEASFEPDALAFAGHLAVAWYERSPQGNLRVKVGLWNKAGEALWQRDLAVGARNARVPVLAAVGERLFVAWVEEDRYSRGDPQPGPPSQIYAAWLDAGGEQVGAPIAVSEASRTTWNLNADVLGDGSVALVFDAEFATASSELYLAVVGEDGVSHARLTPDDGQDSKYPDIAVGPTGAALTWFDAKDGNAEVYLALLAEPAAPSLADLVAFDRDSWRVTRTPGASIGAYLAWSRDGIGLAWNDDTEGENEVWFQRFSERGTEFAPPLRLTETEPDSLIPAIVAHADGYTLAWIEAVLGDDHAEGGGEETRAEVVARHVK